MRRVIKIAKNILSRRPSHVNTRDWMALLTSASRSIARNSLSYLALRALVRVRVRRGTGRAARAISSLSLFPFALKDNECPMMTVENARPVRQMRCSFVSVTFIHALTVHWHDTRIQYDEISTSWNRQNIELGNAKLFVVWHLTNRRCRRERNQSEVLHLRFLVTKWNLMSDNNF